MLTKASTVTVTVDGDIVPTATRRDAKAEGGVAVTPTAIPSYAAVCSASAAYASACSCFGLTGSVTTAPRPTVTVTTTADYCEDF